MAMLVLIPLIEARAAARDVHREIDMRAIVTAQIMYFGKDYAYFTSADWPLAIPLYLPEMPTDPLEETPYVWIDNTGDDQKLCVYATFERGGWFTASHEGNFKCADTKPTLNDCCFQEEVGVEEEVIKEEITNWKTYLNAAYGFEIKYPPRYQYNLYSLETVYEPGVKGWSFEFYEPGRDPFRVRIYEEQPLLEYYLGAYYFLDISPPFEGWVNPEIPTSGHRIINYVEPITFGVDNYQGIKGIAAIGMTDPYVSLIVFFQGKNNAYVFEFPGYYTSELLPLEEEKWKEELKKKPNTKIFFQMLSTFRFLE